jgi:hypothetical protein
LVEVVFESIKMCHPKLPIRREPVIELSPGLGSDPVQSALRIGPGVHQSGLLEDPQVLRYGRLAEAEVINQLAHRPLSIPKQTDNCESLRVTQDLQRCQSRHLRSMSLQLYIRQAMLFGDWP